MTENTARLKVEQLKAAGYKSVAVVDGGTAQVLAKPISAETARVMAIVVRPTRESRHGKPRGGSAVNARKV